MRTSWRPTTARTASTTTVASATLRRLQAARALSAIVAVGAVVALGLGALWPASTSIVTRRAVSGAAPTLVAPIGSVRPAFTPTAADAGTVSVAVVPPVLTNASTTTGLPAVAPARSDGAPVTGPSDAPAAPNGTTPTPTPPASCPLPLPAASSSGGLQSLVGFAPAFGPFASEGFALAPAYAPILQLFGPVIARLAAQNPQAAPVLDPLLATLQTLSTSGYSVLAPGYTPYRPQVLSVETQISQALAPYSEQLAGSPAGACLVDFEAAALSAANG